MRPFDLPLAIVALLAFVAMLPAVMYFLSDAPGFQALSTDAQLLAGFSVPIIALLLLASWAQPGG